MREYKITQQQVDAITEIMYDWYGTGSDVDFRSDYSGRGMYGKTCVGFVVESSVGMLMIGASIAEALRIEQIEGDPTPYDESLQLMHHMITCALVDSMGLGQIVYFPGVTLASEEN